MGSQPENLSAVVVALENLKDNQDEMKEFNLTSFKRIMEKLDVLPKMQIDVAVINEKLQNVNEKLTAHVKQDEENFERQSNDVEDLKKESWTKKGINIAVGGAAGFLAALLHK